MNPLIRTPDRQPQSCPICGKQFVIDVLQPTGDTLCRHCGRLLWFTPPITMSGIHGLSLSDRPIHTKAQAVAAILDRLVEFGVLEGEHRHEVFAAILKREELSSTGIGCGVAIPHAKYSGIGSVIGAIARLPAGVEFDSLDGEPVNLVCLFVSPADRLDEHLRVLEGFARWLREAK